MAVKTYILEQQKGCTIIIIIDMFRKREHKAICYLQLAKLVHLFLTDTTVLYKIQGDSLGLYLLSLYSSSLYYIHNAVKTPGVARVVL